MATKLGERLAPGPTPKRVRVAADGRAGTVQMVYYDRLHTGDSYDELTVELDDDGTVRGSAALFESIDDESTEGDARLIETKTTPMSLLPPAEDGCPICATKHPPEAPHNAQSLYYQYRFYAARGRWPTWADAVAHCKDHVREWWETELREQGAWTEPEGDPIADPPAESFRQVVEIPVETTIVKL